MKPVINLKNSTNRQLGASLWIAIGLLLIMEELFINSETEYSFKSIYISGIFILIYGLLMFIHNNARLKIPVVLMLAFSVSIIECTLNMDATGIGTTSRTSYLLDYDAVKTVTKTVSDNDTSFYRMDKLLVRVLRMMVHGIITELFQHFHQHAMQGCQSFTTL